ncbi:MAG TPA: N-acetylglucosamine-6-phosphate deacetylase [Vicinamibacterales bacterium]|jgi:N-acetylglucosamine-6-phosphate deacetylase|nr:N-acetylglucosamine-6-phosphate deacetylase [Vicinamibacterales bacterium]
MIRLAGADLVLPDRVLTGTVVIHGDRIAAIESTVSAAPAAAGVVNFTFADHYIVPGFVDVHVHGVDGHDSLDGGDAIRRIAELLPRYGVTAFCPTTIACDPAALRAVLQSVAEARSSRPAGARVLPAHLESNFINPDFKGAQPFECLRVPSAPRGAFRWGGDDILDEIAAARPDVGIITIAPELDGALPLIADLASHGHHVSLGHSGASYEQALQGIREGARQATHLFNRMTPVGHREPGLAGAVLESDDVVAELVCDGVHVHPAMMRVALAAKRPERIMAITDGTAGAGLARGSRAVLGGRTITVGDAAYLDDGTIAGSVLTMDRAFATLTGSAGLSLSDAATVCATTPARALGLQGFGVLAAGAIADLAVLDRQFRVVQTWIAGNLVYSEGS